MIDNERPVSDAARIVITQTAIFRRWLDRIPDRKARVRINDRLRRLASGNAGDSKAVGGGVQELRLHFGPGYRIYYIWRGRILVILLTGGDKSSQPRDIDKAMQLAKEADDGLEGFPF